jgi:glycerol kinase
VVSPGGGLVLALDQGSHASRAVLFDAAGTQVAEARVPVATVREGQDRVEQDPEELVRSLQTAIDDVLEPRPGANIVAAGLATQRSTVVAWSRSTGHALHDAISWQDRRAAAWLAQLAPFAARVRAITGLPLSPHYGASKLRWCLDHVPAVQRAAAAGDLALGPLSSFLTFRLSEERVCVADPANAARTLLYDTLSQQWSPELLRLFDLDPAWLPACVPTRPSFGHIACAGLRVPLSACTGDQSAAAFAFGPLDPGCALVNAGTGAFIQRAVPAGAPLPDGILRSVLCVDAEGAVASHEGTVNGAGSALDWLRERVALDVDRGLAALDALPAFAGGLPVFVNGVGGLGAPFWLTDFPSEFVGDGDDAARLAAVIESIAFLLCVNLEALRSAAPLVRLRISGGLARNDYLCRCLAALARLPVERPALVEATARGVAWLAAGKPAAWQPVPVERVFTPLAAPALDARYARWRSEMALRGAKEA